MKSSLVFAGVASFLLALSPAQADQLVVNGGFETGDLTGWTDSGLTAAHNVFNPVNCGNDTDCQASILQQFSEHIWSVSSTGPYAGTYSAMGPVSNTEGCCSNELYQALATASGETYNLSFALNGTGSVFWNDIDVLDITNAGWTTYSLTLFGTSNSTVLGFKGLGVGLDDVSVSTFSPVPVPIVGAGLPGLMFASAGLLGWWRRKRNAEATA